MFENGEFENLNKKKIVESAASDATTVGLYLFLAKF